MELSYLLAPTTILILCIFELNKTQRTTTLGNNGGYFSQLKIVSFKEPTEEITEDMLDGIDYITDTRYNLETLRNRLKYQY